MSRLISTTAALAALLGTLTGAARLSAADPPAGSWKLTFRTERQPIILLLHFSQADGKWVGDFVDATVPFQKDPTVTDVSVSGDAVKFTLALGSSDRLTFDGVVAKDGKKIAGSLDLGGGPLELTELRPSNLKKLDDPIDAFFLEIQGSGRVRLKEGSVLRVGYDGSNGQAYVPVGRLLIERGEIPREQLTMQAIRAWMKAHPKEGAALRRENPSFVFFREITGDGPVGAQRVALTPGRSLAVDRAFIPLGVPIWLEAQERFSNGVYRRLVIAQDTGGAIKGPVRGDLFWGYGREAAEGAGGMNARGRYYLLLPRSVAARVTGAADAH